MKREAFGVRKLACAFRRDGRARTPFRAVLAKGDTPAAAGVKRLGVRRSPGTFAWAVAPKAAVPASRHSPRRFACAHPAAKWIGLLWLGLTPGLGWGLGAETNAFPPFEVQKARDYLDTVSQALAAQAGTNVEAWFIRAQLQSQLGRKDQAERLARQGLERAPERADVHVFLADLLIRQDRLEEAARCLRQAVQLQPQVEGGYRRLGMVLDRLGDHAGAREAFATAVRLLPEDATARLLLGRWLLDNGQAKEAVVHLEKAIRLDPQMAGAYYGMAQAQGQLGDQEAAGKAMNAFRELRQREETAMDVAYGARDNDREMRALAVAFHAEAAAMFGRQGQDSLAEAHLRQAASVAPQEAQPCELLASFYLRKGRWAEARSLFEELARLRPKQLAYRISVGTLHLRLGDYPAAEKEFKGVLELEPKQAEALHNLARLYLARGRELPEALALCQRLVSLEPKAANYDLLGWAFFANGRTNEALTAAAQAVAKDPTNTVYRERYRRVSEAAGKSP